MIKKIKSFFYIFLICFLFVPSYSFAAINEQINYQGKLTDNTGAVVADGDYNMVFSLYTVSSGGSPIWTENRISFNSVTVTKGLFSVMLGEISSLSGVDFNQTLYLGVTIGVDSEMTPRKKLGSVPSAIESKKLQGLFASQFLRSDAANSTSSASTFLNVSQVGAGNIASFTGVGGINALTIKSNGNVGIGEVDPQYNLHVTSTGSPGDMVSFFNTSQDKGLVFGLTSNSKASIWGTNDGSPDDLILNYGGGNVGIGTTTPGQKLSVAGDILGNNIIGSYFTATSTATSTFAGGISTNLLNVTSTTATSTFANGINLNTGCFAINGTCLTAGGGSVAWGSITGTLSSQTDLQSALDAKFSLSSWYATTTDGLAEGSTNRYYSDTLVGNYISSSSTIPHIGGTSYGDLLYWSGSTWNTLATSSLGIATSPWTTSGSDIYYNTGNVGIGTSPAYKLDVLGSPSSSNSNYTLGYFKLSDNVGSTGTTRNGIMSDTEIFGTYATGIGTAINSRSIFGNSVFYGDFGTDGDVLNQYGVVGKATFSGTMNSSSGANVYGGEFTSAGNMTTTGNTQHYGIYVSAQGTADTNTGLYVSASGATNNYAAIFASGNVGIGTTTPGQKLSVAGDILGNNIIGSYFTATSTATSTFAGGISTNLLNVTSTTATSTFANGINLNTGCFAINGTCLTAGGSSPWTTSGSDIYYTTGNVGVGTTSPYTKFAVTGDSSFTATSTFYGDLIFNSSNQSRPNVIQVSPQNGTDKGGVVFATTTSDTAGQSPLLVVQATTTGALDYSRVAVGTSTMGSSGLRDQFTVAGRIYSTWRELRCDSFGLGIVANVSADTSSVCGDFAFDADTDSRIITTTSANPAYGRISAGITTSAAAGEGSALRTWTKFATLAENSVFESKIKLNSATISNEINLAGFYGSTAGSDTATLPTDGAYFIATTTGNWIAITRSASTDTYTDTGVAANTSFAKLRIETSSTKVIFLINDQVVAEHTTNLTSATLAPAILTAITVTGGASRSIDIQYIRVWVDDPPGGYPENIENQFPENSFSPIEGADIAENYLADDITKFKEGVIVTSSNNLSAKVSLSTSPYDKNLIGVVATSPQMTLGTETNDTVRIGMVGRVPVIVSLENGPIKAGDRITSSSVPGVGMKATRPGYIVGFALEDFDPQNNLGQCNLEKVGEPVDPDGKENTKTCQGSVLMKIQNGFDMGIGDVISDIGDEILGVSDALSELASDVFTKGAELTRLAVGKIIAVTGIFKNILASVFTILPDGNINLPRGQNQITGKGMIIAGNTESEIFNSNVAVGSQIYITPTRAIDFSIAVVEKNAGNGFKVRISSAVDFDVTFDWLLINTYLVGDEEEFPINLDTQSDVEAIDSEEGLTVVDDGSGSNSTSTEDVSSDEEIDSSNNEQGSGGNSSQNETSDNTDSGDTVVTEEDTPQVDDLPATEPEPVEQAPEPAPEASTPESPPPADPAPSSGGEETSG